MRCIVRIFCVLFVAQQATAQPTTSVLSEGTWHKMAVTSDGVYRLDRSFLEQYGILSPQDSLQYLHVYGNQSGMLPHANDATTPHDLVALSTWAETGPDEEDYLLFYAQGPDRRYYDAESQLYRIEQNHYDTANYYFLRLETQPSSSPTVRPSIVAEASTVITQRQAVYHHERSLSNLLHSGRAWWGEAMDSETPSFSLTFPAEAATEATLEVSAMSRSTTPSQFSVSVADRIVGALSVNAAQRSEYGYRGRANQAIFTGDDLPAKPTVTLHYESKTEHTGYLDYLALNTREALNYRQKPLRFSDPRARLSTIHQYQIRSATADLQLWDVSDPLSVQSQACRRSDSTLSFRVYADTLQDFVLFDPATVTATPYYVGSVAPQNLHALPTPELLIITRAELRAEAERLASFRQRHDQLDATVVTVSQIYHEFSSGRQDVTALRNFIRLLYQRDTRLRYVLLFGGATYDYLSFANGQVPTYQSRQSLHSVHSYASDDYFGFMDADEGIWPEQGGELNTHNLNIGIGRLPVRTPEEAHTVVDKLIHYASSPEAQGPWRQNVLFVADDGDANKHQHQSDFLASYLEAQRPYFNAQRLFMDAFPQEDSRAPIVRDQLDRAIRHGVFLVDFIGHGGETAWTNEQILDTEMITAWDNYDRLPIFLTATCEFGRFDDPQRVSGAETTLLSPDGGGIALFTTSRPVFTNTNFQISTAFYEAAFGTDTANRRLGDIFRLTKNRSLAGTINRNFVLLGDPSMSLCTTDRSVQLTGLSVNNQPADTLRPLDLVRIRGRIDNIHEIDTSFNGTVYVDLWAAPDTTVTLGQKNGSRPMSYQNYDHRLFHGAVNVRDGIFEIDFRLPKNTRSAYGNGKFSFYALDSERKQAVYGAYSNVVLGGNAPEDYSDRTPPTIQLFFNQTNAPVPTALYPHPTLIVDLEDASGINLADETYGIRLVLDEWQEFSLNDAYQSAPDRPHGGQARFVLPDLVSGNHTVRVLASDTYLNTAERSMSFDIVGDSVLLLQDFTVFPNPSEGELNILFTVGEAVRLSHAEVVVYTITGEVVSQQTFPLERASLSQRLTNILANSASPMLPGTYLYSVAVFDAAGQYEQRRGKLLITR